jgi:GlcNAc-P-P-Und epimerase
LSDRRVLVTGGSGFIGTNLVELCRVNGATVQSLDLRPPQKHEHAAVWRQGDITDSSAVDAAVRAFAPTDVIHLAARTDLDGQSLSDYDVNIQGSANVLSAAGAASSVEHIVVASSRLVCRLGYTPSTDDDYAPHTRYGESKALMEDMVRASSLAKPWTIIRPTSIWGPWFGTPYRDFFLAVARGRYVHPRGRTVQKSFGYVGNTAHQLWELGRHVQQVKARTFYVADYQPIDVHVFANHVRSELGLTAVRSLPMPVLWLIAMAGDVVKRAGALEPPLTRFRLNNLVTPMVYDVGPLREVVGPLPFSPEAGIARTLDWLQDRGML